MIATRNRARLHLRVTSVAVVKYNSAIAERALVFKVKDTEFLSNVYDAVLFESVAELNYREKTVIVICAIRASFSGIN